MENLDKRQQTLIILWAAILMSIGTLFVVSLVAAPAVVQPSPPSTKLLNFGAAALGTFLVGFSFLVRKQLLNRSVAQQDILMVQKALVIGCAMCEACAMLGLMEAFLVGGRDHYLLFFIAAAGIAFHFPKRLNLQAASYKSGTNQGF